MASVRSVPEWRVEIGARETTAVFEPATASGIRSLFVCAHGAGGHMADHGMLALAERFRTCGIDVVRFNFLYREKKSSHPDAMPRLKECMSAVVAWAREEVGPQRLIIGGRSMADARPPCLQPTDSPAMALYCSPIPCIQQANRRSFAMHTSHTSRFLFSA